MIDIRETDETGQRWPHYLTQSQFGAGPLCGRSPSYVSQLKTAGKLVMTPDGKLVDVYASIQLLRATSSPDHQPVADRHASARQTANSSAQPDQIQPQDKNLKAGLSLQKAKAVKEQYLALEAKRAYEVAIGKLRDAREVEHAIATAYTATRTALQSLPTTMAPVLAAAATEEAVRAELAAAIESILVELSTALKSRSTHAQQNASHPSHQPDQP